MRKPKNILIADSSAIILKGLEEILRTLGDNVSTKTVLSAEDLEIHLKTTPVDVVVMNPGFLPESNGEPLAEIFRARRQPLFACLLYSFVDDKILKLFNETIYITDSPEDIVRKIENLVRNSGKKTAIRDEVKLSPRETEVLIYLVKGHSNKEISNLMFISTHTVISHRKNITAKLGVKSVAGLTVYAILNKIVTEEEIREYFNQGV